MERTFWVALMHIWKQFSCSFALRLDESPPSQRRRKYILHGIRVSALWTRRHVGHTRVHCNITRNHYWLFPFCSSLYLHIFWCATRAKLPCSFPTAINASCSHNNNMSTGTRALRRFSAIHIRLSAESWRPGCATNGNESETHISPLMSGRFFAGKWVALAKIA